MATGLSNYSSFKSITFYFASTAKTFLLSSDIREDNYLRSLSTSKDNLSEPWEKWESTQRPNLQWPLESFHRAGWRMGSSECIKCVWYPNNKEDRGAMERQRYLRYSWGSLGKYFWSCKFLCYVPLHRVEWEENSFICNAHKLCDTKKFTWQPKVYIASCIK